MFRKLAVASGVSLLAGCSSVPALDLDRATVAHPTVSDIVEHVACEIALARLQHPNLQGGVYLASVVLTLQADETLGLTPSLSFITPLTPATTTLTKSIGLELSGTKQRVFTDSFSIESDKVPDSIVRTTPAGDRTCAKLGAGGAVLLTGDLGIGEVISSGVESTRKPYVLNFTSDDSSHSKYGSSYGSTIQFTLKRTASAGPAWALVHFKGGGSAAVGRTDTSKLLITVTPLAKPIGKLTELQEREQGQRVEDALARNQTLLTTMILQGITTSPP